MNADRSAAPATDVTVRCREDSEVRVHRWGDPGAPAVLLLHGIRGYGLWFRELAEALAPSHHVLAPDLRGRAGSSHVPDGDYRLDSHADDVEDIVASFGLDTISLVGHSLGGLVALLYGGRHPGHLDNLVVADIGPELDETGVARMRREGQQRPDEFGSWEAARSYLAETHPSGSPQRAAERSQAMLTEGADGRIRWRYDPRIMAPLAAPEPPQRFRRCIARLRCPTLVVRGGRSDLLTAEAAAAMITALPAGSALVTLPEAGHMLMDDDAAGFTSAVVEFVR